MIAYSFHPEAGSELEETSLFYESRMPGLGKLFAAEVERTILLIREFPDVGSVVGLLRYRVVIARFPYALVYQRDPHSITILAVAHQRRYPGYWHKRK